MTTTLVEKIGSNFPTGRDRATIATWAANIPANLVTADQVAQGECYNDSEFSGAVTISGIVTDTTRYVHLTAAATQSFQDHANKTTNALRYNQSNGVAWTTSLANTKLLTVNVGDFKLSRMQLKTSGTGSSQCLNSQAGNSNIRVEDCVFENTGGTSDTVVVFVNAKLVEVFNCLSIADQASGGGITMNHQATTTKISGCTIVRTSNRSAAGTGISHNSAAMTVKNTLVFGFTTVTSSTAIVPTNCATDQTAPESGWTGGITYANVFVDNSATKDFRLHSGTPSSVATGASSAVICSL